MRRHAPALIAAALLLMVGLTLAAPAQAPPAAAETAAQPTGFAAGTTGGTGRVAVTVTSLADTGPGTLRDALARGGGNVQFAPTLVGVISLTSVLSVPADTTIDGAGADVTISSNGLHVDGLAGARNVWIRHLRFHDINATSTSDAIWISDGAVGVWVDHDSFDGAIIDGSVDVTRAATDVELSWNHFVHDPLSDGGDDKTNLLGAAVPTAAPPTPIVDLTVDHNWYERTNSRNPMVRSCRCDVFDNVLDNTGTSSGGYGMKAGCGASVWIRDNAWLNQNGNRFPLTTETGCASDRIPAALVEQPYTIGVAAPASTAQPVTWPATAAGPAAQPMDGTEVTTVEADAGYRPPGSPPTTTTTSSPTTTAPVTTTSTTSAPTTTTAPAGVPTVTAKSAAADAITLTWTAVSAATGYRWTIYTCTKTLVVTKQTAALTKTIDHLAAGCYYATVTAKVAGVMGPAGTSGQVSLP